MGLITEKLEISVNSRTIKYYEKLGYEIPTHIVKNKVKFIRGEKILVYVKDLPYGSNMKIKVKCDNENCGKEYEMKYYDYNRYNHNGKIYCHKCASKIFKSDKNNKKIKTTNNKKEINRNCSEYIEFVKKVLARDNYTCQCCGKKQGDMEVHHLDGYNWCIERRTDETNGITLCKTCHKNFHFNYGSGNNTKEQFEEWIGKAIELVKYEGELPTARKIYCIEENKIYDSAYELSRAWNIAVSQIYSICNHGKQKGDNNYKSLKGKHLLWLDEYEQCTKEDIKRYLEWCKSNHFKKIICINTKEIFNSIVEASNFYKCSDSSILNCCKGKSRFSGKLNGEPMVWLYYEDYIKMTEKEIANYFNEHKIIKPSHGKKVICITTNKIFNTTKEASEFYDIKARSHISACCKGKRNHCGKLEDGTKLQWEYYEDTES